MILGGVVVGGTTGSMNTCLDWAIDGFNVTGSITLYNFVEGTTFALVAARAEQNALKIATAATAALLDVPTSIATIKTNIGGIT